MAPLPDIEYWSVPRCWEGECVAILGGGSSLTQEMADYCRGKCRVIAVNRAGVPQPRGHDGRWVYAPWADWGWFGDVDRFWTYHPEAIDFPGTKIVVRKICPSRDDLRAYASLSAKGVKVLCHSGHKHPIAMGVHDGISHDPGVVHGNNANFMILSIIHHTGASTVLGLGFDFKPGHWHGGYVRVGPHGITCGEPAYEASVVPNFATLVQPLRKAGVSVFICSDRSALPADAWPRAKLEAVL